MNWLDLFIGFDGRIGRKIFWMGTALIGVAELVALFGALLTETDWLIGFVFLVFIYPQFAIAVKRGHDRNIPIWIVGVFFVATGVRDALALLGWDLSNPYRDPITFALLMAYAGFGLALVFELGFRKGRPGPNQYGPDPLGPQTPPPPRS
jgi:uncharacterized membrane protein YhaH (DUF805 family)